MKVIFVEKSLVFNQKPLHHISNIRENSIFTIFVFAGNTSNIDEMLKHNINNFFIKLSQKSKRRIVY